MAQSLYVYMFWLFHGPYSQNTFEMFYSNSHHDHMLHFIVDVQSVVIMSIWNITVTFNHD